MASTPSLSPPSLTSTIVPSVTADATVDVPTNIAAAAAVDFIEFIKVISPSRHKNNQD
jgi:hypothetical protein